MINYEVDAALVDINSLKNIVHHLEKKYNIKVLGILPKQIFYGVVLREVARNLTACFKEYIEKHENLIFEEMSKYSGTQKVRQRRQLGNTCSLFNNSYGDWQKNIYVRQKHQKVVFNVDKS